MKHIYVCPYNSCVECTKKPQPEHCFRCGHNPLEAARRRCFIQSGGLDHGKDGLYCLKISNRAGL